MSKSKKSPRRQGRERAFQVLFGWNFFPNPHKESVRTTFENFVQVRENGPRSELANSFAWGLVSGVVDNLEELDEVIMGFSRNWRLDRIARIELTILRLALYEMLYRHDIPMKVGINEGIELSKKFGDEKSSRFVNGILDAAAERIRTGQLKRSEDDGREPEPVGAD